MLRFLLVFAALALILAGQSSAQTTFYFTQTSTGGTLQPPESGDFGDVTLTLVSSGPAGSGCSSMDQCIEVQLDVTATNSNWNLFSQTGSEPTVGVFAFNAPTGTALVSCADGGGTCSLNQGTTSGMPPVYSGVGYDGLGTYQYTLSANGTGSSTEGGSGNTITGNQVTFYLQDSADPFTSLSPIETPPTGTKSPNPVSDFGLDVCEASSPGSTASCLNNTHAYAAITPEPASCLLFGTGLLSLGAILRRKRGRSVSV